MWKNLLIISYLSWWVSPNVHNHNNFHVGFENLLGCQRSPQWRSSSDLSTANTTTSKQPTLPDCLTAGKPGMEMIVNMIFCLIKYLNDKHD